MKNTNQIKTGMAGLVALCALAPSLGLAQSIVSRSTEMNWESLYGGGPTSFTPSDSLIKNSLDASDSNNLSFTDVQTGDFPIGWTASVDIDINQAHTIVGPSNNFTSISADMDGFKNQSAGGIGVAGISSILPGNLLTFQFVVNSAMSYQLEGHVRYDPNGAFINSYVAIQSFNGVFWTDIIGTRTPDVGNDADFDFVGNLNAGTYRLVSGNLLISGADTYSASNNYTFTNLDAVPEPGTMIVIGAAALFARRRKRK